MKGIGKTVGAAVAVVAVLFCAVAVCGRFSGSSYAVDSIAYGDIDRDGRINLQDAQKILQAALKLEVLEGKEQQAADVSGDSSVTLEDALLVLKHALGVIDIFPAEEGNLPEEKPDMPKDDTEILVAYFSKTGTTRAMAELIGQETGGTLFEIQPVQPYPASYQDTVEIVRRERAEDLRPPIANQVERMQDFKVVFVGFPIWFGDEPYIIRTFLESYDFSGKIVIPFSTSGSSPLEPAQENVENILPNAVVLQGIGLTSADSGSQERVKAWASSCMKQVEELTRGTEQPEESGGSPGEDTEQQGNADGGVSQGDNQKPEGNIMKIHVGQTTFTAELEGNSSARALKELLEQGPLTIEMSGYGNFEKVGSIGTSLPRNDEYITTEPGDIILYQGNSLTIYYDTNSWDFTRVAKIPNITQAELKAALGSGDVTATFSAE